MKRFPLFYANCVVIVCAAALLCCLPLRSQRPSTDDTTNAAANDSVNFKRDIQPIFRRHCYRCHGPRKRRGRLRLTSEKEALKRLDPKKPLIVAGKPDSSHLLQRLTSKKFGDVMPLDSEPLTPEQLALLRRWIASGAEWPEEASDDWHWAYVRPVRPALPVVKNKRWVKNAIDHFVLTRLEDEELSPMEEAERARLLRRVSLALTGLPPTIDEVEAFVADKSPKAYEKVVDRLLKSPGYGEHWARTWLDLARYADTNGFQADQLRDSWAYRDWVIKALNKDMPFDQFTIEQLAGDLLPKATVAQKIATGFHRTVTCNVEAGVHPEANRVNQIFDRVNTTGTVFLGTTMECAQCHDHKYDPFTQEEYYRLFAYFNNTPLEVKNTSGVTFDFVGPAMQLPLPTMQQQRLDKMLADLKSIEQQQKQARAAQSAGYTQWLKEVAAALTMNPATWKTLPIEKFKSTGGEDATLLKDGSVLLGGSLPGTAIYTVEYPGSTRDVVGFKIETLTHKSLPGTGPGRGDAERANFILSEFTVDIVDDKNRHTSISLHSPQADFSQKRWEVEKAIDGNRKTGWAIGPKFHKPHWAMFRTKQPLHIRDNETLVIKLDQNYGRGRTIGRVRLSALIGDERTADLPADVTAIFNKNSKARKPKERNRLRSFFGKSNPRLQNLNRQATQLKRQLQQLKSPTTLVMIEKEKRKTHILKRGNYLDKGQAVTAGTPATLHPLNTKYPKTRLGLAKWLVSKDNPLTARVTVNRWWAEIFGHGLVATPEDFGTQGEWPTHPDLLDWLAVEFMENGWSMKHIHKQIVLSATFRQSARAPRMIHHRDPKNRLYTRGPRFRLSAETIRDNALAISGLLSDKMYGPPIMPYQPTGIWKAVGRNQPKWITATDENRFRRGLYIVWKRSAPYPSFVNFDAPDRASCTVQRPRTNTPLQALTLLNDPAYAEMAMALAQRMMTEAKTKSADAIATRGFRLCVARSPSAREVEIIVRLYQAERKKLQGRPKLVQQRVQNLLPRLRNAKLDGTELAAWFAVANALLNLDETICQ